VDPRGRGCAAEGTGMVTGGCRWLGLKGVLHDGEQAIACNACVMLANPEGDVKGR